MSGLHVLVCGGRDFRDKDLAVSTLNAIHAQSPIALVIHGGCSGADYLAGRWAEAHDVRCQEFCADWNAFGRSAGPRRNQQMVDEGCPDLVVAFAGGRGTSDMISRAAKAGVPVRRVPANLIAGEALQTAQPKAGAVVR